MTTQTWHADRDLLAAYVAGALDPINGASVEQHLDRCAECRADHPAPGRRSDARPGLVRRSCETVESPELPLPARLARRLGVTEPTSILLGATASLRTAWISSAFVALAFAVAGGRTGRAVAPSRPSCSSPRSCRCSASPRPTDRTRTRWSRWS